MYRNFMPLCCILSPMNLSMQNDRNLDQVGGLCLQMDIKHWSVLHRKLNMLNLPCKTVQDYLARLQTRCCAILAMCDSLQGVARYLARSIASCRQALRNAYKQRS